MYTLEGMKCHEVSRSVTKCLLSCERIAKILAMAHNTSIRIPVGPTCIHKCNINVDDRVGPM